MRSLRRFALASALLLPACSVARHHIGGTVRSPNLSLDVQLVVDANFHEQPWNWLTDGILFPIDAALSLFASIGALQDPNVTIAAGPGGTLLAMLLPMCTATYDGRIDTLDELESSRGDNIRTGDHAFLATTDAALQAWSRGEMSLVAALLAGMPQARFAAAMRNGKVDVEPVGELQKR